MNSDYLPTISFYSCFSTRSPNSGSDSTHSFKSAQAATTPPLLRPDALFLSKSNYSPNANFVSIIKPRNEKKELRKIHQSKNCVAYFAGNGTRIRTKDNSI